MKTVVNFSDLIDIFICIFEILSFKSIQKDETGYIIELNSIMFLISIKLYHILFIQCNIYIRIYDFY